MANVSFEGEGSYGSSPRPNFAQPVRGIPALLIKWHIAKDERQASIVQIGMIVVCLALSVYFFTSGGSSSSSAPSDAFGGPGSTQPIDGN